jgi:hypothetical protein
MELVISRKEPVWQALGLEGGGINANNVEEGASNQLWLGALSNAFSSLLDGNLGATTMFDDLIDAQKIV